MNIQLLLTFVILIVSIILFLSDRLRADLIALLTVITLGLTGILSPQEAFSGFSRSAVITILAIFILADGLQRTGVTEQVGNLLLKIAGIRESWLVVIVMLGGALLMVLTRVLTMDQAYQAVDWKSIFLIAGMLPMGVALATSMAFMTPLGHAVNVLVMGPGGYRFQDYFKVGWPLTLLLSVLIISLLPLVWSLTS